MRFIIVFKAFIVSKLVAEFVIFFFRFLTNNFFFRQIINTGIGYFRKIFGILRVKSHFVQEVEIFIGWRYNGWVKYITKLLWRFANRFDNSGINSARCFV